MNNVELKDFVNQKKVNFPIEVSGALLLRSMHGHI